MYQHETQVTDVRPDLYPEHPLQQLARHRTERFQLAFARRAASMLCSTDDCVLQPSGAGLTLFARNEDALEGPVLMLRDEFGFDLELAAPQVRYAGTPLHEPVMHIRVNAPATRINTVRQVLLNRAVYILEESCGGTRCLIRGEAPLVRVLGLSVHLKRLTMGTALVWTGLARYAPCTDPEPTAA